MRPVALTLALAFLAGCSSFDGCESLSIEREPGARPPTGEAPPRELNESRVRAQAPEVAELLDRAVEEGKAEMGSRRASIEGYGYLSQQVPNLGTLRWQNTTLRMYYVVC